jgi:oligopeptide transport system ATP-binding protein
MSLLSVNDLSVEFQIERGWIRAVDGVSFQVEPGETLAIVGESGSGKSVTALAMMGLVAGNAFRTGEIYFNGMNLTRLNEKALRALRGKEIGMVFQDPMTSLNPVLTIGRQIREIFELHKGMSGTASRSAAVEALEMVGMPTPERRLDAYPHEFSGGMRQRVMIAMAVACRPKLLIADEPTTALDVTIQAQILDVISRIQQELGMAMILISHDLGVVAGAADQIAVMYAGRLVETGPIDAVFTNPKMPYTRGLLASVPRFDKVEALPSSIPGAPPDPRYKPSGCAFAPRCAEVVTKCRISAPNLIHLGNNGHKSACHLVKEHKGGTE